MSGYLRFYVCLNVISCLDTVLFEGNMKLQDGVEDKKTFHYMCFSSCHPPGVKNGFIKGEAIKLLRTNSSETVFKTAISQFPNLMERGYPETLVLTTLAEIAFEERKSALLSHDIVLYTKW